MQGGDYGEAGADGGFVIDVTVEERIFFVAVARFLDVRPEGEGAAEGFFVGCDDGDVAGEDGGVGVCDGLGARVVDEDGSVAGELEGAEVGDGFVDGHWGGGGGGEVLRPG